MTNSFLKKKNDLQYNSVSPFVYLYFTLIHISSLLASGILFYPSPWLNEIFFYISFPQPSGIFFQLSIYWDIFKKLNTFLLLEIRDCSLLENLPYLFLLAGTTEILWKKKNQEQLSNQERMICNYIIYRLLPLQ